MLNITIKDILNFLQIEKKDLSEKELLTKIKNISVNSKIIKENTMFVPLKGKKTDGHNYIEEALENGAVMSLAEKQFLINNENKISKNRPVIEVEDTFESLRNISKAIRSKFKGNVIGITGSTGKTTTKEYIYHVLSSKFNVLKNKGNANGQIGVPLTLFGLNNNFDLAILEMGISQFNEMDILSDLVRPNIAVITNIGYSHLKYLKTLDNIFKEKFKITKNFDKGSVLVLNGDDVYLRKIKKLKLPFKVLTFGIENLESDLRACDIRTINNETKFNAVFNNIEYKDLIIPTIGKHNVLNSLAAILLGLYFNIDEKLIKKSLMRCVPVTGRQCIEEVKVLNKNDKLINVTIIDDCYNANPDSMQAALCTLKYIGKNKRKIAILADMLEQGIYSRELHEKLGKYVIDAEVDILLCIGRFTEYTYNFIKEYNNNLKAYKFDKTNREVISFLKNIIEDEDVLLFKGSLGMNLRNILVEFTAI